MLSYPNENTIIKEIERNSFTIQPYTIVDDSLEITNVLEDQWGLYDCEYGSIEIGNEATLRDLMNAESYVAQIYDTYSHSYYYVMCNSATMSDWSEFLQAYNREFGNEFDTFKEAAEFNAIYNVDHIRNLLRNSARRTYSTIRNRCRRL